ncbi:hypothetical protein U1Q18_014978 [Sarracenia purpurea var. burkii]
MEWFILGDTVVDTGVLMRRPQTHLSVQNRNRSPQIPPRGGLSSILAWYINLPS